MIRKRILCTAASLCIAICGNVAAEMESLSGASLKRICASYIDRPENTSDGICIGYVAGVMSIMEYMDVLCLPDKSTHSQATLVVQKHLSDHPEKLHLNAEELVIEALSDAFPCPDTPKN